MYTKYIFDLLYKLEHTSPALCSIDFASQRLAIQLFIYSKSGSISILRELLEDFYIYVRTWLLTSEHVCTTTLFYVRH